MAGSPASTAAVRGGVSALVAEGRVAQPLDSDCSAAPNHRAMSTTAGRAGARPMTFVRRVGRENVRMALRIQRKWHSDAPCPVRGRP